MLTQQQLMTIEAFRLRDIQQFRNMADHFTKHGVSYNDILEYLVHHNEYMRQRLNAEEHILEVLVAKCPECQGTMRPYAVRTPPGEANRYAWQSVWLCDECAHTHYTKEPYKILVKRILADKEANNGTD